MVGFLHEFTKRKIDVEGEAQKEAMLTRQQAEALRYTLKNIVDKIEGELSTLKEATSWEYEPGFCQEMVHEDFEIDNGLLMRVREPPAKGLWGIAASGTKVLRTGQKGCLTYLQVKILKFGGLICIGIAQ
jgi:hypothetical protein